MEFAVHSYEAIIYTALRKELADLVAHGPFESLELAKDGFMLKGRDRSIAYTVTIARSGGLPAAGE
jgi:hypothetical protein